VKEIDRRKTEWIRRRDKHTQLKQHKILFFVLKPFLHYWLDCQWRFMLVKVNEWNALVKAKQDALDRSNRQWLIDHGYKLNQENK
jgi:hypothetical protein